MRALAMAMHRRLLAAAALALCAACGNTLLDHNADPNLLNPPLCDAGFHTCTGSAACVPESESSCGGQCLDCTLTAPANSTPICIAGSGCSFQCTAPARACVAKRTCEVRSPSSCGASCAACPGPAYGQGTPVCSASDVCDFDCAAGSVRCGAGCCGAIQAVASAGPSSLAAGGSHGCAVTLGGGLQCWGANDQGQLGDGSTTSRAFALAVSSLSSGVRAVSAGQGHTCAVTASGAVQCWGANASGQLGDGTPTSRSTPVTAFATGGTAVAAGGAHSCSVVTGSVWCWGSNASGQLGDGTTTPSSTPVASKVPAGTTFVAVTAGGNHSCALSAAGAVYCWGANGRGQIGIGNTTTPQSSPVAVPGLPAGMARVAAGQLHTCASTAATSSTYCWGDNASGQGGAGSNPQTNPTLFGKVNFVVDALSAGTSHTCLVKNGDTVKCFGSNGSDQLGGPAAIGELVDQPTLLGSVAVAAGGLHSCAIHGGEVKCWGGNPQGQLGNPTIVSTSAGPVVVVGH